MRHQLNADIAESLEAYEDSTFNRTHYFFNELPETTRVRLQNVEIDKKHTHLDELMDNTNHVQKEKIEMFTPSMKKMSGLVNSGKVPVYMAGNLSKDIGED